MRLGMPIPDASREPTEWICELATRGCRAAYCPVELDSSHSERAEYAAAARENDIVIAEVGAWGNIATPVAEIREAAIERCTRCLELSEEIGARCCVTTAGSVHPVRGPHPENSSAATHDRIVESIRRILAAVRPRRTRLALEMMPWILPDSAESYRALIDEIDDPGFAAHLDPVNVIRSHHDALHSGAVIRESFAVLGGSIVSCHAKDITIGAGFPIELTETAPGEGLLDYHTFLTEIDACDPDLPLMLEHLQTDAEYLNAALFVRTVHEEIST